MLTVRPAWCPQPIPFVDINTGGVRQLSCSSEAFGPKKIYLLWSEKYPVFEVCSSQSGLFFGYVLKPTGGWYRLGGTKRPEHGEIEGFVR